MARGRRLCAVGAAFRRPCKCAVSDVLLSVLIIMSEFTSGNVARERWLCAVGAGVLDSPLITQQLTLAFNL